MDVKVIKSITGHTQDKTFDKYLKIADEMKETEINKAWGKLPPIIPPEIPTKKPAKKKKETVKEKGKEDVEISSENLKLQHN